MHSFHGFFVDTARKKIYNSGANGPVAQLGECYIRIVEVVGSTPIGSTKAITASAVMAFF